MTNAARRPLVIIDGMIRQLPSGDSIDAPSAEVDVVILTNGAASAATFGTPIYISASSTFQPARANAGATHGVLGLVRDSSIAAAASGSIQTDGVLTGTTAQWDLITGQTGGLAPGSVYFLSSATAGRLTTTAPTNIGEYVLRIGRAISTTALEISVSPHSILL